MIVGFILIVGALWWYLRKNQPAADKAAYERAHRYKPHE